jgi:DNA-binding PadR family transcriptional regulator
MTKWLQSGRRRDVCALLYEADQLHGQRLKTALESHYDERIESKSFYGAMDSLIQRGFVEKRTDGIHDAYALTDAGERALEDHYEWLREKVDG